MRTSLAIATFLVMGVVAGGSITAQVSTTKTTTISGIVALYGSGITGTAAQPVPLNRVKVALYIYETCGVPSSCDTNPHGLLYMTDENGERLETYTDDEGRFSMTFKISTPLMYLPLDLALGVILEDQDRRLAVFDQSQDPGHPACLVTRGFRVEAGSEVEANVTMSIGASNTVSHNVRTVDFTPTAVEGSCENIDAIRYIPATGASTADTGHFPHLAVMYQRIQRAAAVVAEGIGVTLAEPVRVQGWDATTGRNTMSHAQCPGTAIHVPGPVSTLHPATSTEEASLFNIRHEYGHHVMCFSDIAGTRDDPADNDLIDAHAGLANRTSGDSLNEGFADYFAYVVGEAEGDPEPTWLVTDSGVLDLTDTGGHRLDNPLEPGQWQTAGGLTYGEMAEEAAIASLLWEVHAHWLGRDVLWNVLTSNSPDLETFKDVYDALRAAWLFAPFPCQVPVTGSALSSALDCMMVQRGFYHDADGDGLYDNGELVGVTRWPLGTAPSVLEGERGTDVQRPTFPIIPGSEMLLAVEDPSGAPLDGVHLEIGIEYEPPGTADGYQYEWKVAGPQPFRVPIIVPGSPSHAVVRAVRDGYRRSDPLTIEWDFYHHAIDPWKPGGTADTLLEHRFVLQPVDAVNLPPAARAGGPYAGVEAAPVVISAAGSSDPDPGDTLVYAFDCEDDGSFEVLDQAADVFACAYPDNGLFSARVRVTDAAGLSDSASADVAVENAPPVADAGGPYGCLEGVACPVGPAAAADVPADTLTYGWDCDGDSVFESPGGTVVCAPRPDGPATGTAGMRVCDEDGGCTIREAALDVENVAPVVHADAGPHGAPGVDHVLNIGIEDVAGDGPWMVDVAWGDGTTGSDPSPQQAATRTHRYLTAGTYTIEVRVTDKDGGVGTDTVQVVVESTQVAIDIKPGSATNPINPAALGLIPVAVMGGGTFDAAAVDPALVRFGPAGAASRTGGRLEDIDGDGDADMVLHFETLRTGLRHGDTRACLIGRTVDGTAFEGCDAIRTVMSPQ